MRPLIVDALGAGRSGRVATIDALGSGPRAVAGILERKGMEPKIRTAGEALRDHRQVQEYDVLLISAMTVDLPSVKRLVRYWRRTHKDKNVIVGGPISSSPDDALMKAGADLAVIGESERTLQEVLDRDPDLALKDHESIPGTAYHFRGGIVVNPLRPPMSRTEYDSYMPSTKTIRDYPLHFASRVYVEVLRGCSNYRRSRLQLRDDRKCTDCDKCIKGGLYDRYECPAMIPPGCGYCSVPSLFGPPRSRSVERIVEEVSALLDCGVKRIVLSAPDFLDYGRDLLVEPMPLTDPTEPPANHEAIEALLSRLSEIHSFRNGSAAIMVENIKASLVDEALAKIMGEYLAGSAVNIGCETGSETHSVLLGRPSSPKETSRVIELLSRAGLKPYVYFIHGLPGQSIDTARETRNMINESVKKGAERIILYRFQPLPMSAFGDCPAPPPAEGDPGSRIIHEAARQANLKLKRDLLGTSLRVVLAQEYDRDRSYVVAYPLQHGPVVLVRDARSMIGESHEAVIERVVSERMVGGRILSPRDSPVAG